MIWRMEQRFDALRLGIWLGALQRGKFAGYRAGSIQCRRTLSISRANRAQRVIRNSKGGQFRPLEYSPPARKPPPRPTPPATLRDPLRYRKFPLILGGITVLAFSGYSFYLYASLQRAIAEGASINVPADVSYRYNSIAPVFDSSVDSTEKLIGLTRLRKKMVQQASGDVCEVSIGTGRNLTFYDWNFKGIDGTGSQQTKRGKVKSFTAVDKSAEMLEIAHEKFSKEYPGVLGVRWVIQDAAEPLPSPPVSANERSGNKKDKKYDTIVQTMGICSISDPVRLLKNLADSVEDDGRILLLEHGKGTWKWLNRILDGLAPRHALEFGCIWNKDIGKIVEDSGLEVVKMKRKHFGTTWWIELRPKRHQGNTEYLGEQAVTGGHAA